MAFVQKTWKDRVAEYINRRILTKEDGTTELVSVERSEGTISQEGDAFSAENMNDLEQRIANEFSEQNKNLANIVDIKAEIENLRNSVNNLINNPIIKTQDITVDLGVQNKNGFRSQTFTPQTPIGYTLIGAFCRSADQALSTNLCRYNFFAPLSSTPICTMLSIL